MSDRYYDAREGFGNIYEDDYENDYEGAFLDDYADEYEDEQGAGLHGGHYRPQYEHLDRNYIEYDREPRRSANIYHSAAHASAYQRPSRGFEHADVRERLANARLEIIEPPTHLRTDRFAGGQVHPGDSRNPYGGNHYQMNARMAGAWPSSGSGRTQSNWDESYGRSAMGSYQMTGAGNGREFYTPDDYPQALSHASHGQSSSNRQYYTPDMTEDTSFYTADEMPPHRHGHHRSDRGHQDSSDRRRRRYVERHGVRYTTRLERLLQRFG